MRAAAALLAITLAGCTAAAPAPVSWQPPLGPNPVFNAAPGAAPDHRLLVTDLNLPPDAVGAAHFHPWEEYLYVIEGSALLDMEGSPPRTLTAGESFVIPARQVHTPRAGGDGVRAIVIRLHDEGDPERLPADGVEAE
ncbi:cupin domain-containing protein [Aurantiacibacter rhizosphaerae]|uniref:Cupin domain-containing protein n=1 Tax=Aurantiacibacter rhizosphaerae TaxID=2691582 RepID=A0A844XFF3_9SPHN|nr:cupin domain-containing protein [Aurantiacibacter rhizosphaerae]MWV28736.1 cupin domain-containing protein [Aurantiacibacter rhizosphaerae]